MTAQKNSRRRGAILTIAGYEKLQTARAKVERIANVVDRYTREELSKLTGLSLMTISKIFGSETSATGEQLIPVDIQTLALCFVAFDLELERSDYFYPDPLAEPIYKRLNSFDFAAVESPNAEATLTERLWEHDEEPSKIPLQQCGTVDWGEAPDVSVFYGRGEELARLSQWVNDDFCKLVVILGMGGIGKTTLVTKLVSQLQPNFTSIVWRSLRNAPPLTNLLPKIIQILSHQTETVPATMDISAQISRLLYYLRQERCLLVLDNVEAIIQSRSTADSYHHEYSGYPELFRRIGESAHQSCLLLTSREKPEVIIPLEGKELPTRTLTIPGLAAADSENLFDAKGLSKSAAGRGKLSETYSGNPLALNIVATSIYELFDGDIDEFLELETGKFTGISQLLHYQFDRLSPAEQIVMYWLAIERDWISATDLHAQIVPAATMPRLSATLESLGRKSLIERSRGKFTQQAVVMEYITERIVDRVSIELTDKNFRVESSARLQLPLWLSHPLMKAQSPADIRTAQKQLILAPIASQLQLQFGNSTVLERHIQALLIGLHDRYTDLSLYP
jgi:NB-ARC domain